jgi:hypothetical protein
MGLSQAIQGAALVVPEQFDRFGQHLDPEWVEQALVATGLASLRRRRLPAEQVVWLVVGMALMRNESIQRVATLLNVALPTGAGPKPVAPSALTQARQRLGDEPMEYLFKMTASHWAHRSAKAHPWRKLAVYALDGTTVRVPDSLLHQHPQVLRSHPRRAARTSCVRQSLKASLTPPLTAAMHRPGRHSQRLGDAGRTQPLGHSTG